MSAYAINLKNEVGIVAIGNMHAVSRFSQRGFGIIEIGIVLVIVSMLLAVTLGYVRGVLADNRANDEARDLAQTVIRIQRLYNNRSNYTGATLTGLIGNGVFPSERLSGTTGVNNRWGGTVTFALATLATTNDAITLTYSNVPQLECNSVISQVERSVSRILVGTATVKPYAVGGGTLDINSLGTACGTGGSTNSLAFTFGVNQQ